MHDSENERPQRSPIFWLYVFPVLLFTLLIALPYLLAPFNDKALRVFKASFPEQTGIGSFVGSRFFNSSKSAYQITFAADKTSYRQYEPVEFRLAVADKNTYKSVSNFRPALSVSSPSGLLIEDIFGRTAVPMEYDPATHTYTVLWYPALGLSGDYMASASLTNEAFSSPLTETAPLSFIPTPPAPPLKRSYSLIGLDSKELLAQRSILSVNNKEATLSSLSEWMPFLNVDGVLLYGAVSKTYAAAAGVWDTAKLAESETLSKTLAAAGVQPSLIVQMMELEGIEISRLGYQETKYQGAGNNASLDRSVVSLLDKQRAEDLIQILSRLQKNQDISYIALSKFFYNDNYNNELRAEFLKLFPFSPSPESFQKWKSYYASSYLRTVLKKSGGTKPYIAFFTAEELEDNPKMLDMAFAAGVQYAILDCKGTPQNSEALLARLFKDAPSLSSRMILSYQIDFNDYLSGQSSALETWHSSFLGALRRYNFSGLYINDMYEAMFGKRGPYSSYDWMLASASLVSDWKTMGGNLPLIIQKFPPVQETAANVGVSFVFKNQGKSPLSNINLSLLPTIELTGLNPAALTVPALNSGESFYTNIMLTNIRFRQTVLSKKTYFIAVRAGYTGPEKMSQVTLLPFTDPSAEPDSAYRGAVITNQAIQQKTPRTTLPATVIPAPAAAPRSAAPILDTAAAQKPKPQAAPEPPLEQTEETQKLSFLERQRLKRLQKAKEKEEQDRLEAEAKKAKK